MEDSLQLRGVTPPNSVEAERSVLGAMLQDSGAVLQAAEELEENDFYTPAHREIFSGMIQLHRNQSPVDLVTVGCGVEPAWKPGRRGGNGLSH